MLNSEFIKYTSEKAIQNGFRKSVLFVIDKKSTDISKREGLMQLLEWLEQKINKKVLKTYFLNNAEDMGT